MNIFDFENRLKNHASTAKGEVDMNRLLGDLNLTPKSSYRKMFYLLTSVLVLSLSAITYYYFQSAPTETILQPSISEPYLPNNPSKKKAEISATLNTTDNQTADNTILKKDELGFEEKDITLDKSQSLKRKTVKQKNTIVKQIESNNFVNPKTTSTLAQKISKPKATRSKEINTPIENLTPTNEVQKNKLKIEPAFNRALDTKIIRKESKEEAGQTVDNTGQTSNENTSLLPSLSSLLTNFEDPNLSSKLKDCPTFGNRLWHLSVIPELGYSFPLKRLRLDEEEFLDIFNERVANERTIEGISASLSLQFKNQETGLYVKPGISYGRITERVDYEQSDIQTDTTLITIVTTDTNGEILSTETREAITVNETLQRSRVHYELHHFDLPVALGYSFEFDRFAIDIEGGIKFNFLQRTSGQILYAEGEFLDLDNRNQKLFKNSVGLGFFGGILVKRRISSRTELYVAPRFTYNTLSFSTNDNPINQQYNVFGVHIGCAYAIF